MRLLRLQGTERDMRFVSVDLCFAKRLKEMHGGLGL